MGNGNNVIRKASEIISRSLQDPTLLLTDACKGTKCCNDNICCEGKSGGKISCDVASVGLSLTVTMCGNEICSECSAKKDGMSCSQCQVCKQNDTLEVIGDRSKFALDCPNLSQVCQYLWFDTFKSFLKK